MQKPLFLPLPTFFFPTYNTRVMYTIRHPTLSKTLKSTRKSIVRHLALTVFLFHISLSILTLFSSTFINFLLFSHQSFPLSCWMVERTDLGHPACEQDIEINLYRKLIVHRLALTIFLFHISLSISTLFSSTLINHRLFSYQSFTLSCP